MVKLKSLAAKNFRTLEDIEVNFDGNYNAISGPNNAGKSNIADALRILIDNEQYEFYPPVRLDYKTDFTGWRKQKDESPSEPIVIRGLFLLDEGGDEGLISFLRQYLKIADEETLDELALEVSAGPDDEADQLKIVINGKTYSDRTAREVRRRLKDGRLLVYHNSTQGSRLRYYGYGATGQISEISSTVEGILEEQWKIIQRKVKKATTQQQEQLQDLVGRLSEKLTVSVELANFSGYTPYNLTLNENGSDVPLHKWGSGTQNKMMIFLAIIKASKANEAADQTERITPIILLEEPESFLHPSAQAEFGNALMQLAQELDVQVLASTHSVSLINTDKPSANILFDRSEKYKKKLGTTLVPTDGQNWMNPFAALLGFNPESFVPWQDALRLRGQKILLVEGVTDQRYFERLQQISAAPNRLNEEVKIYPYHGVDNICNESILQLVINLSYRCIVTYDLDAEDKVKKTFSTLNLRAKSDFFAIGHGDGRAAIEDLVPNYLKNEVYAENPSIVNRLMGSSKEQRSAKGEMKRKICDKFIEKANFPDDYKEFIALAGQINRAFSSIS